MTDSRFKFTDIFANFDISGSFLSAEPYGSGLINDTFLVCGKGVKERFIFQRINKNVFKDIEKLMHNISRVLDHLAGLEKNEDKLVYLTLIRTKEGKSFYVDEDGNYWRAYIFIEDALSYDRIENPYYAYSAAKAFGNFQKQLSTLEGERLYDTIPDFHNTPKRFNRLLEVIKKDPCNRAKFAKEQIEFAYGREKAAAIIEKLRAEKKIPEIITHNDTKINNVLIDCKTGTAVCVIDLDTVMPGLSLYDFGDMVRTSAARSAEDEKDLRQVGIRLDIFDELVKGFLEGRNGTLNAVEIENLPTSGKIITFETGIRFLTDYIEGDLYFKIKSQDHNLDRTKTQFKLVQTIEEQEETMAGIVSKYKNSIS